MIAPTTPAGSRTTSELPTCSSQVTCSTICGIEPKVMIGRPAWIIAESCTGMPSSDAMRTASSSWRSWSLPEMAAHMAARSSAGVVLHDSNASRAAATARSTSAGVPCGMRPMTSSVEALTTSMVSLPSGATHWPPM